MMTRNVSARIDGSLNTLISLQVLVCSALLAALVLLGGCAGASVKEAKDYDSGELAKPDQIVVFEFSYLPEQEPDIESARELTPEEQAVGKQVSSLVQDSMIEKLNETGIIAGSSSSPNLPAGNSVIVEGEFISIKEGSGAARGAVGFGAGRTSLKTRARAYYYTGGQKKLIKELELSANSGYMPGLVSGVGSPVEMAAAGAGVATDIAIGNDTIADAKRTGEEIAEELTKHFQKVGWVEKEE